MQKFSFQGPEKSRRLFWHGRGKKVTARTSCCNIHNATTPATEELTTAETLARAWEPERALVKTRAWTQVTVGLTTAEKAATAWMQATLYSRARSCMPVTVRPTTNKKYVPVKACGASNSMNKGKSIRQ
jgi:hypothetical protein